MRKPLCIDLFCGLGGWTEGFLADGYEVVGFDIEQHAYGTERYPAHLVLQDVLTIHGKQFKDADIIVASSPCQAYSYMAMPWTRAKQIARGLRGEGEFPEGYDGYRTIEELNALFEAPKRIQREAIEAAGRFIPMIQENVRGAIPWVGRSAWNFGSYHLWGDVPALMPLASGGVKVPGLGAGWRPPGHPDHRPGVSFNGAAVRGNAIAAATKREGKKGVGIGSASWQDKDSRHPDDPRNFGSGSTARKAASARIAKIPFPLASHIARVYRPTLNTEAA